jgi:GNAT superfamily N-acetyltransferase
MAAEAKLPKPHIIRPVRPSDRDMIREFITRQWGADIVITRGRIWKVADLPGFLAEIEGEFAGLVTFHLENDECEIVTLDSLFPGQGIGTDLVAEVRGAALQTGCRRLWLITTNDNLRALRFYQRAGFVITAVYPNSIDAMRKIKPIPLIGMDGIPIRDEIELTIPLSESSILS